VGFETMGTWILAIPESRPGNRPPICSSLPSRRPAAEFERDLIRERTHAGLAAARARGRLGGRPKKLADAKQLELARNLYDGGQTDVATICATLGISRATLYRYLKGRDGARSVPR
jgi:hypothetical protein